MNATPRRPARRVWLLTIALFNVACRATSRVAPSPQTAAALQLIVVTTSDWTTTSGTLRRFERSRPGDAWRAIGATVPVVVGRTGLAWGIGFEPPNAGEPVKHEGDGKSPAGLFALDTAFGFAPADSMRWAKLPYFPLRTESDCVDDPASAHYNTVVDRDRVPRVDWNSAEHMRQIAQYRYGVIVAYNAAPPFRGAGSCIFLHIWAGAGSSTAGCTAFDEKTLRDIIAWLDPRAKPTLAQMPDAAYSRLRGAWGLP